MATAKSSRPVLALEDLEDLEEMDGISLDEMINEGDEPIRSPFIAREESVEEGLDAMDDPFLEDMAGATSEDVVIEVTPDSVEDIPGEVISEDIEAPDDLDVLFDDEPVSTPEPEPTPEPEKPKRTRTRKPKDEPAPVSVVEDDGLSIDDLESMDTMPEYKPEPKADVEVHSETKEIDPIEALITPVGDIPEWTTVVAYGKNGTGKTTFGASGAKTLVIEVEKDGTFSVRERGSEAKKFKVKSWDDFEKIYWYLKKNPGKYDIVCIDTLTRLNELGVRSVVLDKKAEGEELLSKDVFKVTIGQRGDVAQRMIFWLQAFAELPCHKLWLCQEASGSDDKDVANFDVYPDLPRKLRIYVCSDAMVIARTEIRMKTEIVGGKEREIPQYIMRTAPSESYLSKDRSKRLGTGLINPTIDKLIEKVYA